MSNINLGIDTAFEIEDDKLKLVYIVLVGGIQHGGPRDSQGAGTLTFATKEAAEEYANDLDLGNGDLSDRDYNYIRLGRY